jgi:hypothetical protein
VSQDHHDIIAQTHFVQAMKVGFRFGMVLVQCDRVASVRVKAGNVVLAGVSVQDLIVTAIATEKDV